MGEYGHGKPFSFPKEIFYMVIAAIILFGAGIFFGPHLLSAINSGANTNPVEIPKAGDTGQLPIVNETMPVPKQTEKVSGNVTIVGNGLKVEKFDSTFQLKEEARSGTIYVAEWKESVQQADFYLVINRNSAATLKDVVLEFKGTTVKNFTITDNYNGIIVAAEIRTSESFKETVSMLTATEKIPFTQYTLNSISRRVESPKENQEILGQIYVSSQDENERLLKTKILILHVAIIAKVK